MLSTKNTDTLFLGGDGESLQILRRLVCERCVRIAGGWGEPRVWLAGFGWATYALQTQQSWRWRVKGLNK